MLFSVSLKGWHICRRCETHQRRSGTWGQGVEMLIQILGTVTIQKHPRSLGPTPNASSLNKKNHRRGLSNKITLSFFFCITTVWPWDFCLHHAYPPKNATVPKMALEGMSESQPFSRRGLSFLHLMLFSVSLKGWHICRRCETHQRRSGAWGQGVEMLIQILGTVTIQKHPRSLGPTLNTGLSNKITLSFFCITTVWPCDFSCTTHTRQKMALEGMSESQPFSRQGLSFLHLVLFSVSLKGWHICRRCETHQRRSGAWGQGVEMSIQILGTVTIQKHPRSLGPTLKASSLNKRNHRRGLSNKITLSFFFCITTVCGLVTSVCTTHTRQKMALEGMSESQPFSRQGLSFLHLVLFSVSLKGWHICRRCETHQRRSGAWGQGVEMSIQILGTVTIQKHPRSLGPTLKASSLNRKTIEGGYPTR